jgi:hypothetical protein
VPRSRDGRWTRVCEVCGEEFWQRKPGQRTCPLPKPCRARLPHNTGGVRVKAGLEPRACQNPECGKEFQPARESQIACSRTCLLKCPSYIAAQKRHDRKPARRSRSNELRRLDSCPDPADRKFRNLRNNLRRVGVSLTLEQYTEWRARQDGHCAICGRAVSGKSAHADHDHETGQLRDELCTGCNLGLGAFADSPALLRAAADFTDLLREAHCNLRLRQFRGDPELFRKAADYIERHRAA